MIEAHWTHSSPHRRVASHGWLRPDCSSTTDLAASARSCFRTRTSPCSRTQSDTILRTARRSMLARRSVRALPGCCQIPRHMMTRRRSAQLEAASSPGRTSAAGEDRMPMVRNDSCTTRDPHQGTHVGTHHPLHSGRGRGTFHSVSRLSSCRGIAASARSHRTARAAPACLQWERSLGYLAASHYVRCTAAEGPRSRSARESRRAPRSRRSTAASCLWGRRHAAPATEGRPSPEAS